MSNWYCDFPGVEGQFNAQVNFGTSVVNRHQVVMASACKLEQPEGEALDYPFQGQAIFTVHNVVPLNTGYVNVMLDTM